MPRENMRDRRDVDGRGLSVTGVADRLQNWGRKMECSKGHEGGTIVQLGQRRTWSYRTAEVRGRRSEARSWRSTCQAVATALCRRVLGGKRPEHSGATTAPR